MSVLRCRWHLLAIATCLTLPGIAPRVQARQVASPSELKAAFLVNFMKFTNWPEKALPRHAPLVSCIAGDDHVADLIENLTRGREIDKRPVKVRRIAAAAPAEGCHVLFWSASNGRDLPGTAASWSEHPLLTVSDLPGFAEGPGIVSFFIENGKMRFAVNTAAAERAGIRMNPQLLSLARIVKGGVR